MKKATLDFIMGKSPHSFMRERISYLPLIEGKGKPRWNKKTRHAKLEGKASVEGKRLYTNAPHQDVKVSYDPKKKRVLVSLPNGLAYYTYGAYTEVKNPHGGVILDAVSDTWYRTSTSKAKQKSATKPTATTHAGGPFGFLGNAKPSKTFKKTSNKLEPGELAKRLGFKSEEDVEKSYKNAEATSALHDYIVSIQKQATNINNVEENPHGVDVFFKPDLKSSAPAFAARFKREGGRISVEIPFDNTDAGVANRRTLVPDVRDHLQNTPQLDALLKKNESYNPTHFIVATGDDSFLRSTLRHALNRTLAKVPNDAVFSAAVKSLTRNVKDFMGDSAPTDPNIAQAIKNDQDTEEQDKGANYFIHQTDPKLLNITLQDAYRAFTGDTSKENLSLDDYANDIPKDWKIINFSRKTGPGEPVNPHTRHGYLIPPVSEEKQKQIINEIKRRNTSADYVVEKDGGEVKKFNLHDWAYYVAHADQLHAGSLGGIKALPPLELSIYTAPAKEGGRAYLLTDTRGNYEQLNSFYKLTKAFINKKGNTPEMKAIFTLPPKEREEQLKQSERANIIFDLDPNYKMSETKLNIVRDGVQTASDIMDYGDAITKAFPSGILVNEGTGKDTRLIQFDPAGNMYEVMDRTNPKDTNQWRLIPPTIYNTDSLYMKTLKGLANMIKTGTSHTTMNTFAGDTMSVRTAASERIGHHNISQEGLKTFVPWFTSLTDKVSSKMLQDPETRSALQALSAFKEMTFTTGNARTPNNNLVASVLVGRAVRREDAQAKQLINQIVSKTYGNVHDRMEASRRAIHNYNTFAKWVRASSMNKDNEFTFPGDNSHLSAGEARQKFIRELTQAGQDFAEAQATVENSLRKNMPTNLKKVYNHDDEFMQEVYRHSISGKITGWLNNNLIHPLENWLRHGTEQIEGLITHLWELGTHPLRTLTQSIPDFFFSLTIAAKVFVQHTTALFIKRHFSGERKMTLRNGKVVTVNLNPLKKAADNVLNEGIGIRPYNKNDFTRITKMSHTSAYETALAKSIGRTFSHRYKVNFADEEAKRVITDDNVDAVKILVPETANHKPKKLVQVDTTIVNKEKALIPDSLVRMAKLAGPHGLVLISNDRKHLADDLGDNPANNYWVHTKLPSFFRIKSMEPWIKGNGYNSLPMSNPDGVSPRKVTLYVDKEGAPHIRQEFSLDNLFGASAGNVYRKVYGVSVNSQSNMTQPTQESDKIRLVNFLLGVA